jgi:hypothetical protein
MTIQLSPAELERRERAVAADKARRDFYTSTTNAGQAWNPTTRGIATPEPGSGSVMDTFEMIFERELMEATPSPINGHSVEHYEAVRRDVDRRRQELHQQAQAIASRNLKP